MIDAKLIEKNKVRLQEEKQRLENLLSRIAKRDGGSGDYRTSFPEFGDKEDENASEIATYEANLAEEWDLEQRLQKVESAIARISQGTYGKCLAGGEELPEARLEAVPEAESCVGHAK